MKHKKLRLSLPQQREYENELPTEHEGASPKVNKDMRANDFEGLVSLRKIMIFTSKKRRKIQQLFQQ